MSFAIIDPDVQPCLHFTCIQCSHCKTLFIAVGLFKLNDDKQAHPVLPQSMPHTPPPSYDLEKQHDGSQHLAINNTFFNRISTRLASYTIGRLYQRQGICIRISRNKILKAGRRVHLTEGATMKYLADNTDVPVPKVFCSFIHKKQAYIVMERIRGKPLSMCLNDMSEKSLKNLLAQLKRIFSELHALEPRQGTGVESCTGGSLYDDRIPHGIPRFGPFKSVQDFHSWLRQGITSESLESRTVDQDWHDLQKMISTQDGPWPSPRFAHGDLNPYNILIHNSNVVGIIDWEFSGWYPHYWEFTSAWFGNVTRSRWQQMLNQFLYVPSSEEFQMEETRHQWWGEYV